MIFWILVVLVLWYKLELKYWFKYRKEKPYELIDLQIETRKLNENRRSSSVQRLGNRRSKD